MHSVVLKQWPYCFSNTTNRVGNLYFEKHHFSSSTRVFRAEAGNNEGRSKCIIIVLSMLHLKIGTKRYFLKEYCVTKLLMLCTFMSLTFLD